MQRDSISFIAVFHKEYPVLKDIADLKLHRKQGDKLG